MNISDTQSLLLSAASQRDDQLIPLSERLKGGAARSVADGLLSRGLAEEITVSRSSCFWREEEGEHFGLRITRAGLAAIGLDDESGPTLAPDKSSGEPDAARGQCEAHHKARPASASGLSTEGRATPGQPRAAGKQRHLIDMLMRSEGASVVEIANALGWLPHTTRAALTGLRHKGYHLKRETVEERGGIYRIAERSLAVTASPGIISAEAA